MKNLNEIKIELKTEIKDINLKLNDIDKRLYGIKAILRMKYCYLLK